ncbi:MAG: CbtB domain-containing protein [Microcystaceae cyanobacterium]
MTSQAFSTVGQRAVNVTLSTPVQSLLYLSLCSLTLWTLFFSNYPAVHNAAHSLRHNTLSISCH